MKIALLFWGLTRSLKLTIDNLNKYILNNLKENNIEYKIYLHTYYFEDKENKYDFNEYKLLNPDYFVLDDQDKVKQNINIEKYYNLNFKYSNKVIHNLICGLYSQKRVTELLLDTIKNKKETFDYIWFIRPDVLFNKPLPIRWLHWINENRFLVPRFAKFRGINDRMAIMKLNLAEKYGKRFDKLKEFSEYSKKHNFKLSSEIYLNLIMINYKKKYINYVFKRIRSNGSIHKLDLRLF